MSRRPRIRLLEGGRGLAWFRESHPRPAYDRPTPTDAPLVVLRDAAFKLRRGATGRRAYCEGTRHRKRECPGLGQRRRQPRAGRRGCPCRREARTQASVVLSSDCVPQLPIRTPNQVSIRGLVGHANRGSRSNPSLAGKLTPDQAEEVRRLRACGVAWPSLPSGLAWRGARSARWFCARSSLAHGS